MSETLFRLKPPQWEQESPDLWFAHTAYGALWLSYSGPGYDRPWFLDVYDLDKEQSRSGFYASREEALQQVKELHLARMLVSLEPINENSRPEERL